jgi:hypothetical protein
VAGGEDLVDDLAASMSAAVIVWVTGAVIDIHGLFGEGRCGVDRNQGVMQPDPLGLRCPANYRRPWQSGDHPSSVGTRLPADPRQRSSGGHAVLSCGTDEQPQATIRPVT